jgi:hypothetical protein
VASNAPGLPRHLALLEPASPQVLCHLAHPITSPESDIIEISSNPKTSSLASFPRTTPTRTLNPKYVFSPPPTPLRKAASWLAMTRTCPRRAGVVLVGHHVFPITSISNELLSPYQLFSPTSIKGSRPYLCGGVRHWVGSDMVEA